MSKPIRPLTHRIDVAAEVDRAEQAGAEHLVDGVVAADVLAGGDQLAVEVKTPDAWIEPVLPNNGWRSRSRSGSERITSGPTVAVDGHDRVGRGEDLVQALGPADAARRRHRRRPTRRVPLGWSVEIDRDDVVALLLRQVLGRRSRRPGAGGLPAPITPSDSRKPAASSKSDPGVRITTAARVAGWPGQESRISIGSSVTTVSGRRRTSSPTTSTTLRRLVAPGRWGSRLTCPW